MKRPLFKQVSAKRLSGSLTVEAVYVFSLVFLSVTAATRFVYREQARCVSGFLLEAMAGEAARGDSRFETATVHPEELNARYMPRLATMLPLAESQFTVWNERNRGGVELRLPKQNARIEIQNPRPEDALRRDAAHPTTAP